MSSESSRSITSVLPLLKAASSSKRLEMLLEPGKRTTPPAPARGGISINEVAYMVLGAALDAGALEVELPQRWGFVAVMRQCARALLA